MRLFRDYGLTIILAVLFLGSWLLQSTTGWVEFAAEQHAHGQVAQLFGSSGYFWSWMQSTFENWQSEFLQLVWQAVGLALLLFWGSSQSKESDERIEAKLDRLLEDRGIDPGAVSEEVNRTLHGPRGS